jgi:hypothetical protein
MPGGEKLPRLKESAIAALLESSTLDEAAGKVGVSSRTLINWMRRPDFRGAYLEARRRLVDAVVTRLARDAAEALDTLRRNLSCGKPAAEVRAAAFIVDRSFAGLELLDLAERVAQLESEWEGRPHVLAGATKTPDQPSAARRPG